MQSTVLEKLPSPPSTPAHELESWVTGDHLSQSQELAVDSIATAAVVVAEALGSSAAEIKNNKLTDLERKELAWHHERLMGSDEAKLLAWDIVQAAYPADDTDRQKELASLWPDGDPNGKLKLMELAFVNAVGAVYKMSKYGLGGEAEKAAKTLQWWREELAKTLPPPKPPKPHVSDGTSSYERMLLINQAMGRHKPELVRKFGEQAVLASMNSAVEQVGSTTEGALSDTELGANRPIKIDKVMLAALKADAESEMPEPGFGFNPEDAKAVASRETALSGRRQAARVALAATSKGELQKNGYGLRPRIPKVR